MNRIRSGILVAVCIVVLGSTAASQWYQGPSGGRGGSKFNFWESSGGNSALSGVSILHDADGTILCIQLNYQNGFNQKYGGRCGETGPRAGLVGQGFYGDWSRFGLGQGEYLIGISGRYDDQIKSLTFYTTKQNHSYGTSGGTDSFGYTAPTGHRIVALFGRAGDRIDAIGVMYAPIPGNPRVERVTPRP